MNVRRLAVVTAAGLIVAGGAGAAIATTRGDDPKQTEQAILADAAKRLDVSPSALRDALAAAQDAQLDQAVKDGKLTQAQADAIKERRKQSGLVLGMHRPHGPHMGIVLLRPRFELFNVIAKELGISRRELMTELRSGKTLAQIAKDHDKSLDDVKSAVRAAMKKRLDAAVKAGKLTQAQADEMLSRVDHFVDHFGERPPHFFHHRPGENDDELHFHAKPGTDDGPGEVYAAPAPAGAF